MKYTFSFTNLKSSDMLTALTLTTHTNFYKWIARFSAGKLYIPIKHSLKKYNFLKMIFSSYINLTCSPGHTKPGLNIQLK
jgi:hypothetical protein